MAGDYLFARALTLLSKESTKDALPFMVESIQAMCEGIIEEISTFFDPAVTESDYLSRIDKKTASLVTACCGAGSSGKGGFSGRGGCLCGFWTQFRYVLSDH